MSRKLVTVRRIDAINTIEDADFIVKAKIDGWNVITKKGEFDVGDYGVYFEIDSFLNIEDERYEFLIKSSRKKMNGQEGLRVKTMKLRGVISQGLILPMRMFPEVQALVDDGASSLESLRNDRYDLSDTLGVVKYEPPETGSGCPPAGNFPHWIPKTDEERIQSIYTKTSEVHADSWFVPSLKLDGSSCTVAYVNNPELFVSTYEEGAEPTEEIVVCSRNLALKYVPDATFWKGLENDNIPENLANWCRENKRQVGIQGELVGPGVQKNREKFNQYKVFAFRAFDIDKQEFLSVHDFKVLCNDINMDTTIFYEAIQPFKEYTTIEELMKAAEGDSINHGVREGLVYNLVGSYDTPDLQENQNRFSFKTISNKFLIKTDS